MMSNGVICGNCHKPDNKQSVGLLMEPVRKFVLAVCHCGWLMIGQRVTGFIHKLPRVNSEGYQSGFDGLRQYQKIVVKLVVLAA